MPGKRLVALNPLVWLEVARLGAQNVLTNPCKHSDARTPSPNPQAPRGQACCPAPEIEEEEREETDGSLLQRTEIPDEELQVGQGECR